jgi:hypothetical protein
VETLALAAGSAFPLGERVVVESVPLEGINVERLTLYYRSGRTSDALSQIVEHLLDVVVLFEAVD